MNLFGIQWGRNDPGPVRRAMDRHRGQFPRCAACNDDDVDVHHIIPMHVAPSRGADPDNLISLCPRCHFAHGHACNWSRYVPNVREVLAARRVLP